VRACPTCGTAEQRGTWNGTEWVNLCPINDLCVDCLAAQVKTFRSRRFEADQPPLLDVKAAAAGDRA
jgi:hypothetical protein